MSREEEFYIYNPDEEYIEDFVKRTGEKIDVLEMVDWTDRRVIRRVLEYLRDYGLLFRLEEEMESMRKWWCDEL